MEDRISLTRKIASEEYPCTKNSRFALSSICLLNSFSLPAPKRIRLGVAKSNENIGLPILVGRKDIGVLESLSWFSHHCRDCVAPAPVMGRLFVSGWRSGR